MEISTSLSNRRVILISSVLDSMPTYVMYLPSIPGKMVKVLDALRRCLNW